LLVLDVDVNALFVLALCCCLLALLLLSRTGGWIDSCSGGGSVCTFVCMYVCMYVRILHTKNAWVPDQREGEGEGEGVKLPTYVCTYVYSPPGLGECGGHLGTSRAGHARTDAAVKSRARSV